MPTAVAEEALTELVCALEDVRDDALRSSVLTLLADRSFAPFTEASRLIRRGPVDLHRGEVLRRVLRHDSAGSGRESELDRFLLDSVALSALRARRVFLVRELLNRWRHSSPRRAFRATSLGIGAHAELLELLAHESVQPVAVEATIIDADARGVEKTLERVRAQGLNGVVRGMVRDPSRFAGDDGALVPQDVILAPYQLDFLSDADATSMLDRALEGLAPGGELLTAHWHHDLTARDRLVVGGFLGWEPTFRKPRALARLIQGVARKCGATAVGLLRGPNLYFVIQRGA